MVSRKGKAVTFLLVSFSINTLYFKIHFTGFELLKIVYMGKNTVYFSCSFCDLTHHRNMTYYLDDTVIFRTSLFQHYTGSASLLGCFLPNE